MNELEETSARSAIGRPLIFGELLYDEFEDGSARPGGAPLNVAWHLRGFGLNPLLITRVGEDTLGGIALSRMQRARLDVRGVQVDAERSTGRATVELGDDRTPRFLLPDDQAYDYIDAEAMPSLQREHLELLYHGTLAARNERSAAALRKLRELGLPTFIDVNLRAPWWDTERVTALIGGARWLKVNAGELAALENQRHGRTLLERAQRLRERFGLEAVIVTCGAEGAVAATEHDSLMAPAERVVEVTDSVGGGDAFSAVVIIGILRAWTLGATLRRAVEFASAVCAKPGGLDEDRGLYEHFLTRWRH
jgi:fructokinase